MRPLLTAATLLLLGLCQLAQAQTTAEKGAVIAAKPAAAGNTYGIIIGISGYSELPKLNYAHKDAILFYNLLRKNLPAKDSSNLSLFVNQSARKDDIIQRMYDVGDQVREGDQVFVFFSGHGDVEQLIQTDNTLLLLGESPAKNYLRKSNGYLDIATMKTFFQSWTAKKARVIFICDACHSGNLIGGEEGKKNSVLGLQQSWQNEIKILSCQPDEVSFESDKWGGGRGLFSYYLLLGLKGMADKNADFQVSLRELESYLKEEVSENSANKQTPAIYGDLKSVVLKTNDQFLAEAKSELKTKGSTDYGFASRGGGSPDTLLNGLFSRFQQLLQAGNILEPEAQSAYALYQQAQLRNSSDIRVREMRALLINALKGSFNDLLPYFYNDEYEKFGVIEKFAVERNLNTCLQLAGTNELLKNELKARLLFLNACELAIDIRPGSNDYFTREKLQKGIALLKQAAALDPLGAYIQLRLGDYYLYTNQLPAAITAYTTYQQLLPNDEYSYNKLGLAYMYQREKDKAIAAFRKAIAINPDFFTRLRRICGLRAGDNVKMWRCEDVEMADARGVRGKKQFRSTWLE